MKCSTSSSRRCSATRSKLASSARRACVQAHWCRCTACRRGTKSPMVRGDFPRPGLFSSPPFEFAMTHRYRSTYAVWEITLACNLRCVHCGSRAGKARPNELTTAEALDLVEQLADLGVAEVSLIGGEAFLRPD